MKELKTCKKISLNELSFIFLIIFIWSQTIVLTYVKAFITRIPLIGRFNEVISVIGINTQKGKVLTEAISDKFEFSDLLSESEAIESNDNFICPIIRPVERASFYNSVMTK